MDDRSDQERSIYWNLYFRDDRMICPAACRGEPIVGGSKGVCPLGRRAWVDAPPEKGRQQAEARVGRGKSVPPPS